MTSRPVRAEAGDVSPTERKEKLDEDQDHRRRGALARSPSRPPPRRPRRPSRSAARPRSRRWRRSWRGRTSRTTTSASRSSRAAPTSASPTSRAAACTIGNSSRDPKDGDPGGIVFNKIARDALCIVTNPRQPAREPVAGSRSRRSSPAGSGTGRSVPGAVDRAARSACSSARAASGTQDAFQKIFMGAAEGRRRAPARRRRTASSSSRSSRDTHGDRLRVARLHRRASTPCATRASRAPCATRSPASTAARATSGWSPAGAPRARPRSSSSWIANQHGRQADHRDRVGAAQLDGQDMPADPAGHAQAGPARRANARRAGVRASCC